MTAKRTHVGVVGVGTMGRPMTRRLLNRPDLVVGVTGRHADRYADLVEAGARWHESVRSLAGTVGVLLLTLPDLPEVEQVLAGDDGILAADPQDLVLVVSSTSSPAGVRALGDRLARETEGRVRVVDAPLSGGPEGANAGTLSVMVGGADADVGRAVDVLRSCGTPVHLGRLGSGQVAKACNQLVAAATMLALGEASVLASRSGLDLAALFDLFEGGYADSRLLRGRRDRFLHEDYSQAARARYLAKDVGFAAEVAAATGTDAPLTAELAALWRDVVDRGLGELDIAVARRYIESRR